MPCARAHGRRKRQRRVLGGDDLTALGDSRHARGDIHRVTKDVAAFEYA